MSSGNSFCLDTSAYSAFNRGDGRLKRWFSASSEICVPLIVIGELRAGFAAGTKQQINNNLLQRFLDAANVHTMTLSDKTTRLFAEIYFNLRQNGNPIGANDMWIAALAMEHELPLLTLDSHFLGITGLQLIEI